MKVMYTAAATTEGGRNGHVASSDGILDMDVTMPEGLGGKGGKTNPEQLFAAGYSSCFGSALDLVAKQAKVDLPQNKITAEVSIGQDDSGFGLAVKLTAHLQGVDKATAEGLINKAHEVCPYSKATRNNIPVELVVVTD